MYAILLLSALLSIPLITAAPGISPFASGWVRVETECSGLTATKVERMVTELLGERILSLPGVRDVYSSSTAEKSLLLLRMPWYLRKDQIMSQLLKAIERVRPRMPEGAQEPKVSYIENSSPPILLGITPREEESTGSAPSHPETIVHSLRRLRRFSEVEIYGLSKEEIHIHLDPYLLGPSSLTLASTLSTISSSLFNFTAGGTVENHISIPVEISGGVDSLEKLRKLPLDEADGDTRLSEISGISSNHRRTHEIRVNGERGLLVSAVPGERGKVPLLAAIFNLMNPEKTITGAFPGWRVSVLSNPYRTLVLSAFSTVALVSLTSAASLLIAVHYRGAGFRVRTFSETLCTALLAASVILSLVYALYPVSAAPGQLSTPPGQLTAAPEQPSPAGSYRRFFLIGDNSLTDFLEQFAESLPEETEMWTFPASLCGFSAPSDILPAIPILFPLSSSLSITASLVAEDITSLFIRSSSVPEVLSLLKSHGFVPVPAASPAIVIQDNRNLRGKEERDIFSLGGKREEGLTIVPHPHLLPEDIAESGGIAKILEAAFDGIRLGTMETRRITASRAPASKESLFAARRLNTPVYLFYGEDYHQSSTSYGITSLPTTIGEAVPPLEELAETTSSSTLRRIVSLNGSPVLYRFLPYGEGHTPPKELGKE